MSCLSLLKLTLIFIIAVILSAYFYNPVEKIVLRGEEAENFMKLDKYSKYDFLKSYSPDFDAATIFFDNSGKCQCLWLVGTDNLNVYDYKYYGYNKCLKNASDILIMIA